MKIKITLIGILLILSVGAFCGNILGEGDAAYYKDDLGTSYLKCFDNKITFNEVSSAKVLLDGAYAFAQESKRIYAFEKTSGKEMWKYPTDKILEESITSDCLGYDGVLYFTTLNTLYALDEETGKIICRKPIAETSHALLKVYDNVLFVACDNKKVYRFNLKNGEEVAEPFVYTSSTGKIQMIIIKNILLTLDGDGKVLGFDLNNPKKKKYQFTVPTSSLDNRIYVSGDYIVSSSQEQVILFSLKTGKEFARKRIPAGISCTTISDGKSIYVPCDNSKIIKLNMDKKLSQADFEIRIPSSIKNLIALSDNKLLAEDSNGLITLFELSSKKPVWNYQPGQYTAGGVSTTVPGIGTSDIYVNESTTTMGGGNMGSRGGNRGNSRNGNNRSGNNRRGGNYRSQDLDSFTGILMAQGPMGGPGGFGGRGGNRGGRGGRGGFGGGMNGMTTTKTITQVTVIKQNGIMYDIDIDKFYNNNDREFVPTNIIDKAVYENGTVAFVSETGHFSVYSIEGQDKIEPYYFEFSPGSTSENKSVSANEDILVKFCIFDKGSGINFTSAKLTCVADDGTEYKPHLIYEPEKQVFYGWIKANKNGVIIEPFPEGTMKCVFSVKDYAGNELNKKFDFKVDASLAVKKGEIPSSSYYDVLTGQLVDVESGDLNEGIFSQSEKTSKNSSNNSNGTKNISTNGQKLASNSSEDGGVTSTDKKKI